MTDPKARERLLTILCEKFTDGDMRYQDAADAILAAYPQIAEAPPSGNDAVEAARSILARPQHHIMPEERIAATYILSLAPGKDEITERVGSNKRLNAVGDLRGRVDAYWAARGTKSKIDAVYLKGDGAVRVEWSDADGDFGPYHIRLQELYAPVIAPGKDARETAREMVGDWCHAGITGSGNFARIAGDQIAAAITAAVERHNAEVERLTHAEQAAKDSLKEVMADCFAANTKVDRLTRERDRFAKMANGELANTHADLVREYTLGLKDGADKYRQRAEAAESALAAAQKRVGVLGNVLNRLLWELRDLPPGELEDLYQEARAALAAPRDQVTNDQRLEECRC